MVFIGREAGGFCIGEGRAPGNDGCGIAGSASSRRRVFLDGEQFIRFYVFQHGAVPEGPADDQPADEAVVAEPEMQSWIYRGLVAPRGFFLQQLPAAAADRQYAGADRRGIGSSAFEQYREPMPAGELRMIFPDHGRSAEPVHDEIEIAIVI